MNLTHEKVEEIQDNLQRLQDHLELSQAKLAEKIGIPKTTVSEILSGKLFHRQSIGDDKVKAIEQGCKDNGITYRVNPGVKKKPTLKKAQVSLISDDDQPLVNEKAEAFDTTHADKMADKGIREPSVSSDTFDRLSSLKLELVAAMNNYNKVAREITDLGAAIISTENKQGEIHLICLEARVRI